MFDADRNRSTLAACEPTVLMGQPQSASDVYERSDEDACMCIQVGVLKRMGGAVTAIAYVDSGERNGALVGSSEGELILVNLETLHLQTEADADSVMELTKPCRADGPIHAILPMPVGALVVLLRPDCVIEMYDINTSQTIGEFKAGDKSAFLTVRHFSAEFRKICQADKSAVATVSKTKELKKRVLGSRKKMVRQFWKPSSVRAAPLSDLRSGTWLRKGGVRGVWVELSGAGDARELAVQHGGERAAGGGHRADERVGPKQPRHLRGQRAHHRGGGRPRARSGGRSAQGACVFCVCVCVCVCVSTGWGNPGWACGHARQPCTPPRG